jgi:hypothetical protein
MTIYYLNPIHRTPTSTIKVTTCNTRSRNDRAFHLQTGSPIKYSTQFFVTRRDIGYDTAALPDSAAIFLGGRKMVEN